MRSFRDAEGQRWAIVVDERLLDRVHFLTFVNLALVFDEDHRNDMLDLLCDHATARVDVLAAVLEWQLDRFDLGREDLSARLATPVVATSALWALIDALTDWVKR
jgi:hypothetical protein